MLSLTSESGFFNIAAGQSSALPGDTGIPADFTAPIGVERLGEVYIAFADEDPHRWAMVFEHRLADGRTVPPWYHDKVLRMFAMVEDGLEPLAGPRPREEITQAARALWGGVHGICILALSDTLGITGVDSVQQLTRSLIGNYLKGFVSR